MSRKLVDAVWIHQRMRDKDDRFIRQQAIAAERRRRMEETLQALRAARQAETNDGGAR
jgi:hypothetical protein